MPSPSPSEQMRQLLHGFEVSQCLAVAVELGIADHLAQRARSASELAKAANANPGALRRLLLALVALGLLGRDEQDLFSLTPLGDTLRTDVTGSLHDEIRLFLHHSTWRSWGELGSAIRTGQAAFPRVFGLDVWSWRAMNPDGGTVLDTLLSGMTWREVEDLIPRIDLAGVHHVIDVGGGRGALLAAILRHCPDLVGTLFERPPVLEEARKLLTSAGIAERCRLEPGDFFHSIPADGDCYLLKGILHDWSDEQARSILGVCRKSMLPGAKLVVIEHLAESQPSLPSALLDLHLLVIHGGKERSGLQYGELLTAAGFSVQSMQKAQDGKGIIQAIPMVRKGS